MILVLCDKGNIFRLTRERYNYGQEKGYFNQVILFQSSFTLVKIQSGQKAR